jgi:GNAT superfamily N-acetyltransferase
MGRPAAGMAYVEADKIEAVNVLREFQRNGVGRALMAWAQSRVREIGHALATVETQEANAPAFCESLGYRVTRHWGADGLYRRPHPDDDHDQVP